MTFAASPHKIELKGCLSSADMHKNSPVFIDVPEGVTNIHFRFDHSPQKAFDQTMAYQISLMVFDPIGPRIEISRPDDEGSFVNAARATPGGSPGPIPAGQWIVFIQVFRLLSDAPVTYKLEVTMSFDPVDDAPLVWEPGSVSSRGPGWYRGDLHAHTIHSDGRWDVPDLVQFWKDYGVDFLTLSDHNTITGVPQARSLADDELLVLGGNELSRFFGHALAVDIQDQWFDWRKTDGSQIAMSQLAQQVVDSGALFIIAHPMDGGDPGCCGCRWEFEDMMPGSALGIEIWNGYWEHRNQEALKLFYKWLNQGYRLVATSGTDLHGPPPENVRGALNVVYAQDLSVEGIVEAIKAGRSYVSAGPELILTAKTVSGIEGMIGDTLPPEAATVTVRWNQSHEGDYIRLVVDGWVYKEKIVDASGEINWSLTSGQGKWITAELRDLNSDLWAVTNPIFFG